MEFQSQFTQLDLRSYATEVCSHSHSFAQVVLPLVGSLELEIGQNSGIASENVAAFIQPEERHCFVGSKENLCLVVDAPWDRLPVIMLSMPTFLNLTASAKQFLQFTRGYLTNEDSNFSSNYLVHQLLFNLVSQPRLSENDRQVFRAKSWIDLHVTAAIDIEQVARHCCLSSSQLQRRFKRSTGFSVGEYWRRKKIEQAKLLLLSTGNKSIEEVAFLVGYENLSAFSRRFSQSVGISPSLWRERMLTAKRMREKDKVF